MNQNYKIKFHCFFIHLRLALLLSMVGLMAITTGYWRKSFADSVVTFTVVNTNDGGAGSLRQAILDANASLGTDTIIFNIGSGVQTIRPATPLPVLTDPVVIDGSTQPGFSGTPLIVIDGSLITTASGDVYGLRIAGGNSILRSIAINNFQNPAPQALRIDTEGGNTVQGCYIGVDPNGTTRRRNYIGIVIVSSDNLIGGTTTAERNVISGSSFDNITIAGAGSNNRIQGNYIGTNAAGTASLSDSSGHGVNIFSTGTGNIVGGTQTGAGNVISGNGTGGITLSGFDNVGSIVQGNLIGTDVTGTFPFGNGNGLGFDIRSSNNLIGGTTAAARNIISGNNTAIDIGSGTTALLTGNIIQGNYIGTDITGTIALSNRGAQAISVTGSNTAIGGGVEGAGNIIAYNNGVGVRITGSFGPNTGNTIRRNSFFTNGGLAIDLGTAGVTANDACDGDTGANNLQNYPVLTSAVSNGTTTNVTGTLNSAANAAFTIDFYLSPTYDASTFGEGKTYLGSADVTTAANCSAVLNVALPYPAAGSQFITAIATDSNGNTSEFSQYVRATGTGVKTNFDYDGDGKADLSVFRPSAGSWFISHSSNNAFVSTQFGANGDLIAPADFDGDGKTDISVFRPTDGGWYRLNSSNNTFTALQFGASGDLPVPGDFDGDLKADICVYRPSAGSWYRINSSNQQFIAAQFGVAEDKPLVGDFDGDGKADLVVFRPSSGTWYLLRTTAGFTGFQFGTSGDVPTPNAFVR